MRRRGELARRIAIAVALLSLTGCVNVSQLAFKNDHRLRFLAPVDRELVTLPLTLRWEMADFRLVEPGSEPPSKGAGYFAVFVDRAPIKPGKPLRDVAKGDRSCLRVPACPDAQYLADRGVYPTASPELTLTAIAALNTKQTVQMHYAVVVLLDSEGRRIGESSWRREFKIRKRTFG